MIAVLQRVSSARVDVEGKTVGAIGPGLLVLVCAEQGDTQVQGDKLLAKILKLRIFNDAHGKMNHSLQDMDGAGTAGGLYEGFVEAARRVHAVVQTGIFATHMEVSLVNDGPVTIPMRIPPAV